MPKLFMQEKLNSEWPEDVFRTCVMVSKNMDKQKNSEPIVSILTPVYNGEMYLVECIESVLAQTYENWEYVIVNNRSTDRSLEIAEKYAAKDSRIRIHTYDEHLQVMQSLNQSFKQISPESKYCKVIHADDWMFPECVSKMVEAAELHPDVGIVSAFRLINKNVGPSGLSYPALNLSGVEICRRFLLDGENYFCAPSNILIRSNLIRNQEKVYDESYLQSDIAACLNFLRDSDFSFIHQVLTFTRRHKSSATERIAKKNSAYMFGYLKMYLQYGPVFLDDLELEEFRKKRIGIYYIQLARNLYSKNPLKSFKRNKNELESINTEFSYLKLFYHLIVEFFKVPVLMIIKKVGE